MEWLVNFFVGHLTQQNIQSVAITWVRVVVFNATFNNISVISWKLSLSVCHLCFTFWPSQICMNDVCDVLFIFFSFKIYIYIKSNLIAAKNYNRNKFPWIKNIFFTYWLQFFLQKFKKKLNFGHGSRKNYYSVKHIILRIYTFSFVVVVDSLYFVLGPGGSMS